MGAPPNRELNNSPAPNPKSFYGRKYDKFDIFIWINIKIFWGLNNKLVECSLHPLIYRTKTIIDKHRFIFFYWKGRNIHKQSISITLLPKLFHILSISVTFHIRNSSIYLLYKWEQCLRYIFLYLYLTIKKMEINWLNFCVKKKRTKVCLFFIVKGLLFLLCYLPCCTNMWYEWYDVYE